MYLLSQRFREREIIKGGVGEGERKLEEERRECEGHVMANWALGQW